MPKKKNKILFFALFFKTAIKHHLTMFYVLQNKQFIDFSLIHRHVTFSSIKNWLKISLKFLGMSSIMTHVLQYKQILSTWKGNKEFCSERFWIVSTSGLSKASNFFAFRNNSEQTSDQRTDLVIGIKSTISPLTVARARLFTELL